MRLLYCLLLVGAAGLLSSGQPGNEAASEKRVSDLLRRMTLEEKVAMLAGAGWMETVAHPRLGIPAIKMADGPMGVRSWLGTSAATSAAAKPITSTAFPSGIAMAATWDPELVQREGKTIGQEAKALGRDMLLGPTVNIARAPLWGRNFEGYGEDPYLAARLAVAYIRGVQGEGVIATVKHFAANNEEYERHRIDEKIDERALQEIYFPAFQAAVREAGVRAVMNAYNKVNGLYCAENPHLLADVLRKQWGFQGFVVSDWGSTYSTVGTVNAGMDLEMPGGEAMRTWLVRPKTKEDGNGCGFLTPEKVLPEVKAGRISVATVDEHVGRMLRAMFAMGLFDKPKTGGGAVDTPEQRAVAREAATQGIVLLKNAGNALPLDTGKLRSVAVIGPNAAVARTGGGGSSQVRPNYAVTPLDAIKERAGGRVRVEYALGVTMEGEDAKDNPRLREEAVALAKKSDAAVLVVGYAPTLESEGFDRKTLNLPAGQDELIRAVAAANKNTLVVVNAGSPVAIPWIGQAPAVLDMWYGGQEGGHGIAAVLFGDANPAGKLPVTFPKEMKDSPAYGHYPGENLRVEYAEGIYVGYRHFDTRNIEPLFPFGHGLSYTTFGYGGLQITPGSPVRVSFQVRNTGSRAGAEVAQLYLHQAKAGVDRPAKELKGFRKLVLKPGEAQTVTLTLDRSAMSYYSPAKKAWVAEPGTFEVTVGASSRDLRLRGNFELR
ncbi:MAG: glycoside hydrolase family 3 C-terminal domain-containing protein [Acidobacteriia bacterium]|nr:glycoside hydrolase family 3 C-terminal domain-containing protein [Terriglobia bacterium]